MTQLAALADPPGEDVAPLGQRDGVEGSADDELGRVRVGFRVRVSG